MPPSQTPLTDELNALYPDPTDPRRRRWKAAKLIEKVAARTFSVSGCVGGRTVTVSQVRLDDNGYVSCHITHPDLPLVYPDGRTSVNPFLFANPPLIHGGAEDPVNAARQIVRESFAEALAKFG